MRVGVNVLLVMDVHDRHGHGRSSRDIPRLVLDRLVRRDARVARRDSVRESNGFPDARAEIGQLLQMRPVQWSLRIGDGCPELVLQLLQGLWLIDEIEGGMGEGPRCCLQAGPDDRLRLVA